MQTIEITQEDIDAGLPTNLRCPLARAINRLLVKGIEAVVLGGGCAEVQFRLSVNGSPRLVVSLPLEARMFVSNYDNFGREAVIPMTFSWEAPGIYFQKEEQEV